MADIGEVLRHLGKLHVVVEQREERRMVQEVRLEGELCCAEFKRHLWKKETHEDHPLLDRPMDLIRYRVDRRRVIWWHDRSSKRAGQAWFPLAYCPYCGVELPAYVD